MVMMEVSLLSSVSDRNSSRTSTFILTFRCKCKNLQQLQKRRKIKNRVQKFALFVSFSNLMTFRVKKVKKVKRLKRSELILQRNGLTIFFIFLSCPIVLVVFLKSSNLKTKTVKKNIYTSLLPVNSSLSKQICLFSMKRTFSLKFRQRIYQCATFVVHWNTFYQ